MFLFTRRRRRNTSESASAVYLAFTTQPGTGGASPYTVNPKPVVAAKKSKGTTDTAKAGTVTIALVVLSGSPVLSGTTTKALASGVADFSANGLTVTGAGTWYLVATLAGLTGATSVTGTTTGNVAPNTPTISAGTPSSSGVTLTSSAFSDPDVGDTHAASQWQVTTSADTGYASTVISTGDDAVNKTSYAASGLSASTAYIARVRHKDSAGNYSSYSSNASFTTASGGTVNRSDNFNRTDSAISLGAPSDGGSAWSLRKGTQGIASNKAYMVAGATLDSVTSTLGGAFSTLTCDVNGTLSIDLTRDGSNNGNGGFVVRYVDANNFFLVEQNGNFIAIYKIAAGSASTLYSALSLNYPFSSFSSTLQVVLTAAGFTVKTVDSVNGTQTEKVITDSTGNDKVEHGAVTGDSVLRVDNFVWTGA